MGKPKRRNDKHLTVISRQKPWDAESFAAAVAAFVLWRLERRDADNANGEHYSTTPEKKR